MINNFVSLGHGRTLNVALLAVFSVAGAAACSSSAPGTGEQEGPASRRPGALAPESYAVADDEEALHLLAAVGLPGRVLKFFEPSPGVLLEIEKGVAAEVRHEPEEASLSGTALYTYLTGEAAPQALIDAEWRATPASEAPSDDEAVNSYGGTEARPSSALPGLSTTTVESNVRAQRGDFFQNYCTQTDRFWIAPWTSTESWAEGSGINYMKAGAYCDFGTIAYSSFFGVQNHGGFLEEGHYTGWREKAGGSGVKARSQVKPEAESIYDHCINYHF